MDCCYYFLVMFIHNDNTSVNFHRGVLIPKTNGSDIFFDSKYDIKRPDIVSFILLVKEKKNVKLPRRKSVMDLIKDIYWNVK